MNAASGKARDGPAQGRGTGGQRAEGSNPLTGETADVAAIILGLAVVAIGMVLVRDGTVSDVEESVFRAVNDLPEWLYGVAWPFQQLGALVLGPVVAIVATIMRRYRLAVAALVVTALKLLSERMVKSIVSRQRPGTSVGADIEVRGDVHLTGESFVSGHAVLVAALAGVVSPYLPGRWKVLPWALVGAVMVGRVYVGAHLPLDVVCGAALGVAIAGAVNLATGVRRHPVGPRIGRVQRAQGAPDPGTRSRWSAVLP